MPFALPRGAPFASLAPALSLPWDLGLFAYFLTAEALAVFSTWTLAAIERYSRVRILELAAAKGRRERALRYLSRIGTYELTVRVTRFLGNALLVGGIVFLVVRRRVLDRPEAWTSMPWGALLEALLISFGVAFLLNDLLVRLLARRRPNRFLESAFPLLQTLRVVTAPIRAPVRVLAWIAFRIRLEGPAPGPREEVRRLIEEGEREGAFTGHEADMVQGALALRDRTVGDVFVARGAMDAVRAEAPLEEAAAFLGQTGRSRVPVYGRDRDEIVGVLHGRDLLGRAPPRAAAPPTVRDVMRPPLFVTQSRPLGEFLREMLDRKAHLAIVLNDFGGAAGVVTLEDLVEEVVGDIEDELDAEDAARASGSAPPGGALEFDGRTPIEEVNRALSLDLPTGEDFETVGGLMLHGLGKVPRPGDRLQVGPISLLVTEADERRVKRLRVVLPGRS